MQTLIPDQDLKELLESIGVNLDDANRQNLGQQVQQTLSERVGTEITQFLEEDQKQQFDQIIESDNQEVLSQWLEQNVPDYEAVVADEIDILLGELAENNGKMPN